jgi:multiple sugar transport system permease protein
VPAVLVSVAFALPLVVMVSSSLREPGTPPPRTPALVPTDPTFQAYDQAFDLVDLAGQLRNSLLVSVTASAVAVVSASLAGFAIARLHRRAAGLLVALAVIALVIPPTALVVGRFVLYRQVGLIDTYVPLVAPALYGVSPLGVLLFAWSFRRLPPSLFDVARIEGLSPLAMWWRVGMPLVRPMTIAVATLAFALTWSDFLSPLAFITSESRATLPLGLRSMQLVGEQDVPVLLAGCVVATMPVVLAFAGAQRWLFSAARGVR